MAMASINNNTSIKLFDGKGFSNWSFRIKLHLEQNELLETLEKKNSSTSQSDFDKKDLKARDLIVKWLDDSVLSVIQNKKIAKEMFEALENTYVRKGLAAQVELKRELAEMRFKKGSLSAYLEQYEKKVFDLKCSGATIDEEEIITQLLASMPDSYQVVATAVDIASDHSFKITLEYVKGKLIQEEVGQNKNCRFITAGN